MLFLCPRKFPGLLISSFSKAKDFFLRESKIQVTDAGSNFLNLKFLRAILGFCRKERRKERNRRCWQVWRGRDLRGIGDTIPLVASRMGTFLYLSWRACTQFVLFAALSHRVSFPQVTKNHVPWLQQPAVETTRTSLPCLRMLCATSSTRRSRAAASSTPSRSALWARRPGDPAPPAQQN